MGCVCASMYVLSFPSLQLEPAGCFQAHLGKGHRSQLGFYEVHDNS